VASTWSALAAALPQRQPGGIEAPDLRVAGCLVKRGTGRAAPCAPRTAWNSLAYSDLKRSRLPSSGSVRST